MNKQDPPPPTAEEIQLWLDSERPFATAFLERSYSQINYADAEDIFSDFCREQWKLGEAGIKVRERGVLVSRLRPRAIDFIRHRNANFRGGGAEHADLTEVQDRVPDNRKDIYADILEIGEWRLLKDLLKAVQDRCNRRQCTFAQVALEVLETGMAISKWWEAFSPEQRVEFMTNSQGELNEDLEAFRREVNRARRQVTAKLKGLLRTKNVPWLN
jgi:hypothetical protein